jgi:hypothetical protein
VKNAWSYTSISHTPSLDSQGQKNNKENLRTKKEGKKEIKRKWTEEKKDGNKTNKTRKEKRDEGKKERNVIKEERKTSESFGMFSISPPTFRSKLLPSCSNQKSGFNYNLWSLPSTVC